MAAIPAIDSAHLEAVCKVLGDTANGLTGGEIERLLQGRGIADPGPITKWQRLHQALLAQQARDRCANNVVAFIADAMAPARYLNSRQVFEARRAALNVALAFVGMSVGDDGNVERRDVAKTLSEAEGRASLLRRALQDRKVHPEVLKFCRADLLEDNYFHAVLEATKSVAPAPKASTCAACSGSRSSATPTKSYRLPQPRKQRPAPHETTQRCRDFAVLRGSEHPAQSVTCKPTPRNPRTKHPPATVCYCTENERTPLPTPRSGVGLNELLGRNPDLIARQAC